MRSRFTIGGANSQPCMLVFVVSFSDPEAEAPTRSANVPAEVHGPPHQNTCAMRMQIQRCSAMRNASMYVEAASPSQYDYNVLLYTVFLHLASYTFLFSFGISGVCVASVCCAHKNDDILKLHIDGDGFGCLQPLS